MNGSKRIQRMPKQGTRRAAQTGFTLVEMLIAAVILAAVATAAFRFYHNQHQQYIRQTDAADAQQNIRVTMQELTRQIRQAGFGAFGLPPVVISATNDSLLVRYAQGGVVRSQRFFVRADETGRRNLVTQIDAALPQVFAEGIDSVRFVGGGPGSGVKWVTVTIVASGQHAEVDYAGTSPAGNHLVRRLSSTVTLRNR